MPVHIIGHSGFIGRHIAEFFGNSDGHEYSSGYSFEQGDLTKPGSENRLAKHLSPETTLIVLAAIKRQMGESLETFEANMCITSSICRAIEKSPVNRVVFISSAAVYGEDVAHECITEETVLMPRTYYGLAKYNAEWQLRASVEKGGATSLCIVRPPTIYGPGDTSLSYGPPQFIDRVLRNEKITLWGDGSELREFIYVKDAAKIIATLAESEYDGVVNLTSGSSCSFVEILSAVKGACGAEVEVDSRPRSKDKVDHMFDNTQLRTIMPDVSFTPLQQGVKSLYEHMRSSHEKSAR